MALVKLNNRGVRSASAFGSISALGEMIFIKKLTASASSDLSFVDGTSDVVLDDTYKEYVFTFNNMHASNTTVGFGFNGSIDTGSNYNVTKTTTNFNAYHNEADSATNLGYRTAEDLAQSTALQKFQQNWGTDNDQAGSGYLHLFNPSSTTFVKHFIGRVSNYHESDYAIDCYVAGYFNTTSAVDAIQFAMSAGNIDSGDICLYGIN
jgi:hypothetical protein